MNEKYTIFTIKSDIILRYNENLPEIPKLATSYIESIKKGVLQLDQKKKYF